MTKLQEQRFTDSLRNAIASSRMEGLEVSDSMKDMIVTVFRGEHTLDECMKQLRYTLVTEVSTMVTITDIPKEDHNELAFTKKEITELERAKSMPITFDEDCPETTPERALKFRRVNPVRRTAN